MRRIPPCCKKQKCLLVMTPWDLADVIDMCKWYTSFNLPKLFGSANARLLLLVEVLDLHMSLEPSDQASIIIAIASQSAATLMCPCNPAWSRVLGNFAMRHHHAAVPATMQI